MLWWVSEGKMRSKAQIWKCSLITWESLLRKRSAFKTHSSFCLPELCSKSGNTVCSEFRDMPKSLDHISHISTRHIKMILYIEYSVLGSGFIWVPCTDPYALFMNGSEPGMSWQKCSEMENDWSAPWYWQSYKCDM